jgi:hypothetical protein
VALCGDPGIGKTTVASLVRTHAAIQRLFPQIIYVPHVGHTANIKKLLSRILEQLPAIRSDHWGQRLADRRWENPEEWKKDLAARLGSRPRTLLVLEDVWTHEALGALNICTGSSQHKLLVTSCNSTILSEFDEMRCRVFCQELQLEERHARDLLCMHAFPPHSNPPQEEGWGRLIAAVAQKCRHLPLSLAVRDASTPRFALPLHFCKDPLLLCFCRCLQQSLMVLE